MPVADLPPSAQAMYPTWWRTIQAWANQVEAGTPRFDVFSDVASAAAQINREFPAQFSGYSPPGVSALLSQALAIRDARDAFSAADPSRIVDETMVARPPWSKDDATMATLPVWQVRSEVTYTTSEGVTETGIFMSKLENTIRLPKSTITSVVEYQVASMLASPPGTGTPRSGDLVSVDSITLLAV